MDPRRIHHKQKDTALKNIIPIPSNKIPSDINPAMSIEKLNKMLPQKILMIQIDKYCRSLMEREQ